MKKRSIIIMALCAIVIFALIEFNINCTNNIDTADVKISGSQIPSIKQNKNNFIMEESFFCEEEYVVLNFCDRKFKIVIPGYLYTTNKVIEKKNVFALYNENYRLIIEDEKYDENKYKYLNGEIDDLSSDYDNILKSTMLYDNIFYSSYSQSENKNGKIVVRAAVSHDDTKYFGLKYYIIDNNTKEMFSIEFTKKYNYVETDQRYRYFFNFDEHLLNFMCGFDVQNVWVGMSSDEIINRKELRNLVQEQIISHENGEINLQEEISEENFDNFIKYIAFLEYWGSFENDAIKIAEESGFSPDFH